MNGANTGSFQVKPPQKPAPSVAPPKPQTKVAGDLAEAMLAARNADAVAGVGAPPDEPELSHEDNLTLAKLDLGTDYTATVTLGGFMFKVAYPSVLEDEMIMIEEERQYDGVRNPSGDLKTTAFVWATLGVVVKEIWKIDGEPKPRRIEGNFSQVFKSVRNARKVYKLIVLPLYAKYLEFEGRLNEEVDPLKNI